MESLLEDLKAWLRIPSVSALPEYHGAVLAAADFTAKLFAQAGLENVRQIAGNGFPLVYGDWLHAPEAPTLLCYGHYDVQPAEPLEKWNTPPFEPTQIGEDLFARGAADDKGLAILPIKAVEHFLANGRPLPVNVRFLYEGEEESGGDHIASHLAQYAGELKANAALICDTEMFAPGMPTICTGLRGILYGELIVRTGRTDLHSGVYGGNVRNAVEEAARLVAALKDADGRVIVPGFYEGVAVPAETELASWRTLPFDVEKYREKEAQVFALHGDPDYGLLERVWCRPTLEIHGIRGGFTGEGAKTVIPCEAVVKLSARLVPDQDPHHCVAMLTQHLAAITPAGVETQFRLLHSAPAALVDADSPFVQKCAAAMSEAFGAPTVYMRSGGSIPIVGLFAGKLGIPSVLAGFGLPDDNLHAPNEKIHLPNLTRGLAALVRYFEILGGAPPAGTN